MKNPCIDSHKSQNSMLSVAKLPGLESYICHLLAKLVILGKLPNVSLS